MSRTLDILLRTRPDERRPEHIETPWGPSQTIRERAPGVFAISTAGHGGYWITEPALSQMPRELRAIEPWAGPGWYEEDEDWCLVVLAFPRLFEDRDIFYAVRTAIHARYKDRAMAWLRTPRGKLLWAKFRKYAEQHAEHYECVGMGTNGKGWSSTWRRFHDQHMVYAFHPRGHDVPTGPVVVETLRPFIVKENA